MNRIEQLEYAMNQVVQTSVEPDLSDLLNELSFSYMMVTSAQQSLDDLSVSIQELEELVDHHLSV
ncbi:MAG: hypothetical protein LBV09_03045 [Deferribacteraceae bacterium]|jgi:hypothetical protein|nr:hypothetical protein [Deferribacteraceae bacterium]